MTEDENLAECIEKIESALESLNNLEMVTEKVESWLQQLTDLHTEMGFHYERYYKSS